MIYSGNAIRVAATCQPATKAKIHLQWKANLYDFEGRHIYFTDWFSGVFVFEITKTKTPKLTVKFDLKLCGKNRTEDNLTGSSTI